MRRDYGSIPRRKIGGVRLPRLQSSGQQLLGRVGLGLTIPHGESMIDGVFQEGHEMGALGLHLAGGVDVRLVRGLSAMAEYKLTSTTESVAISEGQAHGRFTSHHVVFGIGWHL